MYLSYPIPVLFDLFTCHVLTCFDVSIFFNILDLLTFLYIITFFDILTLFIDAFTFLYI